jgi:c-di-AMP phosphodiesterase-like protein
MVTEVVQYFEIREKLDSDYADALLSGIMTDTKNFVMQTGSRTFEAAAFLIKSGADTVKVKNLFADSIETFRERSRIISEAEFIGHCALGMAGTVETGNLKVISSQAADRLLEIKGVYASFVIYEINEVVHISARSYGKVNVQLIMEELGGGGHQTMAATQLYDTTMGEAREMLVDILKTKEAEGELIA